MRVQQAQSGVTGAARAALQLYAMYRPLAARQDAEKLLDLPFGGEAGRLILLTVREGRDLAAEAARIEETCPTERPAPGKPEPAVLPWLHITPPQPGSLMSFLRHRFPGFASPEWSASACDVGTALALPACRITAVDSCVQALAYGARRALKLGVDNIVFSAGVAMSAAAEQQFHFVDARRGNSAALALPACRITAVDSCVQALAYGARRALKLGVDNIVFSAGVAMSAAAEQQFHFVDARRGNSAASFTMLAGLLLPGGLLRLDVACTERSAMLRSAFEFGARQAQGSLQFARRPYRRSDGKRTDCAFFNGKQLRVPGFDCGYRSSKCLRMR